MDNCTFCKIVEGKGKSWTVYEDELVKAFLDINPVSEGHTLIIPKTHYENVYDIPEGELKRIITIAKKLAKIYRKALGARAVNILHASGKEAQQDVFHFHIHLVPRYKNDKLNLWYRSRPQIKANFDEILEKIEKFT
jgi:histidine triad (HIT) family protein